MERQRAFVADGNGSYNISILENVIDKKYKYITTKQVELELDDEKGFFDIDTEYILERQHGRHSKGR